MGKEKASGFVAVCDDACNQRCAEEGYVFADDAHEIHLTEKGKRIAEDTYERHSTFCRLLTGLGVDEKTAAADACGMSQWFLFRDWKSTRTGGRYTVTAVRYALQQRNMTFSVFLLRIKGVSLPMTRYIRRSGERMPMVMKAMP